MKVYKDHSFLVFDLENGKTCKYDFFEKKAYGFSGKPVKDICSQLRGYTVEKVIESCVDNNYGAFLRAIRDDLFSSCSWINIGTLLKYVPLYGGLEPFFSAGVNKVEGMKRFSIPFKQVPKNVLRICREHDIPLREAFVDGYKRNPDGYNIAFSLDYCSLTASDLFRILGEQRSWWYGDSRLCFNWMVKTYGYTSKSLLQYIDRVVTYEALDVMEAMNLLRDTLDMTSKMSQKFDRYPKYLKTVHDIARRNYNRLKETYDELAFSKRYNSQQMECNIGDFSFIYPKSPQDIKDEAVQQHNCVASYINRVINGACDILFMRRKNQPDVSLVTLEVVNGKIVQRKQRYNTDTTPSQNEAISKWEAWYAKKAV